PPLVFSSDTATTAISTLSLHDALPIFGIEIPLLAGDADDRADAALRPEVGSEHVVDDDHVRLRQRRRPCDLHRIEPLRPRRQLDADFAADPRGPGPRRDDDGAGIDAPGARLDADDATLAAQDLPDRSPLENPRAELGAPAGE